MNFESLIRFCWNHCIAIICVFKFFVPTDVIYADEFELDNPSIMKDKQCKKTERFSVMAKWINYFLSLHDKAKQRYKVKTNNI